MIPVGSLPGVGQPDLPEPTLRGSGGADPAGKKASSFDDLLGNSAKSDDDKDAAALKDDAQSAADAKDPVKPANPAPLTGWPWMVMTATATPPESTAPLTDSPTLQGNADTADNVNASASPTSSTAASSPALLGGGIGTLKRALMATAPMSGNGLPATGSDGSSPDGVSLLRPRLGFPPVKLSPTEGLAIKTPVPAPATTPLPDADSASSADPVSPPAFDDPTLLASPLEIGMVRHIPTDTPPADAIIKPAPAPVSTPDPLPLQLPPDAEPTAPASPDAAADLALPRPMLGGPGWKPSTLPTDDNSAALPAPMLGGPGWKPNSLPTNGGPVAQPAPISATQPITASASTEATTANPVANVSANPVMTTAASATTAVDAASVSANAVFVTGTENFAPKAAARLVGNAAAANAFTRQVSGNKANKEAISGIGTSAAKTTDSMSASQFTGQSSARSGGEQSSFAASGDEVPDSEISAKNHGATVSSAFGLAGESLTPAPGTLSSDTASLPANGGTASTRASDAAMLLQRTMEAGEQMRANGRGHVEIQVPVNDKENVTVQLRWQNGSLHTTFRTDSPELRQALERDWGQFTASTQERGLPLAAKLNFESNGGNASSSAGGQNDFSRQQQQPSQNGADDASSLSFSTDYLRVAANPRASLAAAAAAAPASARKDSWKAWA